MKPGRWNSIVGTLATALCVASVDSGYGVEPPDPPGLVQFAPRVPIDQQNTTSTNAMFRSADRTTQRLLSTARKLIDEAHYVDAVRCLGAIFDGLEDFFIDPDRDNPVDRSLKSEAQELVGRMPKRGRAEYELQFGVSARRMLDEAVMAGDADQLAEVVRRFFQTEAGNEAALLLGIHHLDHGRPWAAALMLQRVRDNSPDSDRLEPTLSLTLATCWVQAGMEAEATVALNRLYERRPETSVTIGGEEVPLFGGSRDPADRLKWLAETVGAAGHFGPDPIGQWPMYRGNSERSASSSASGPLLSMRWRVPTTNDPLVEALLGKLWEDDLSQERLPQPCMQALAVDGTVLMRTLHNLLAVDFKTGKRRWEIPLENPIAAALDSPSEGSFRSALPRLEVILRTRVWKDATYGRISSDGELVFSIEDLGWNVLPRHGSLIGIRGLIRPDPFSPKSYNRLTAYDVQSGELRWELGGSAGDSKLARAGTFFLGVPLPLMGRLYVLAEASGEIRLLALNAADGEVLWSQQLVGVDQDIRSMPTRHLAGLSPSYADGVLVCPTSNRSVVALELASRSLLWGYTYSVKDQSYLQRAALFAVSSASGSASRSYWTDSSVLLAEGLAVLTPPDSPMTVCLDLFRGECLWREPRRSETHDDLYVAGLYQGNVVLVGRRHVRAVRLKETRLDPASDTTRPLPAWNERVVEFPQRGGPSGIGFQSGNRYYVPLTSAQVMAVDLDSGKAAEVSSSRRGIVPGNLIGHRDKIVSQRAGYLEVFDQRDALEKEVARRLAADPDDSAALALHGEILWDRGALDRAVDAFHRSLRSGPNAEIQVLLREALFDGLKEEFATHRDAVDQMQGLLDDPIHRAMFLRLMADGFETAGELDAALGQYVKLIDLDREHPDMVEVEPSYSVRRDRWIRNRLASLFDAADDDLRKRIDRLASIRLKAALEADGLAALLDFNDYFGFHPVADRARDELIRRYREADRTAEVELLVARRQPDVPVRAEVESPTIWPEGAVVVRETGPKSPGNVTSSRALIERTEHQSPFFDELDVELHGDPVQLAGRDGYGKYQWYFPLGQRAIEDGLPLRDRIMRVSSRGHVLFLTSGTQTLALDTLGLDEQRPRLLWTANTYSSGGESPALRRLREQIANRIETRGESRLEWSDGRGQIVDAPVIANRRLLCFKRPNRCVAVDSLTGETVWIRRDLRPDDRVFGDDEYVFVAPRREGVATVLRTEDGQVVGTRPVSPDRAATLGRFELIWRDVGTHNRLEVIDPWEGVPVWPARRFLPKSSIERVGDDLLAVREQEGRFVLLNLLDGRTIIDTKLDFDITMRETLVLSEPTGFLLIAYNPIRSSVPNRRIINVRQVPSQLIGHGQIWAFDREGNSLWPEPVEIRDQCLIYNQPGRLPILAFVCSTQEVRSDPRTSVLCIDKRNGRKVGSWDLPGEAKTFEIVGHPDRATVELRLNQRTISMTLTDQPLPPEAEDDSASDGLRSILESLWDGLRKAAFDPEEE